jgi:hypothetical protein
MTIDVVFLDSGRDPQCKPDQKYPDGMTINLAEHASQETCTKNLPYPAPRCGIYMVTCTICGYSAALTVAGRPDDPRILTIPCKSKIEQCL